MLFEYLQYYFVSILANDRSRSPASQRGASPARPPPPPQPEEPELKMAKDTDGPIPMPAPTSSANTTSVPNTQSNDQQVPSADGTTAGNAPPLAPAPPAPAEPARDPNGIALEKLEQMKQSLDALEKEVDIFTGSTRNNRAYKLLDEQALKIMIRCDELVDVSADIKEKRKEMIRNVQRVIGKLESKVPATPAMEDNSNPMETAIHLTEQSPERTHHETIEQKSSSPVKETSSTHPIEQSITS